MGLNRIEAQGPHWQAVPRKVCFQFKERRGIKSNLSTHRKCLYQPPVSVVRCPSAFSNGMSTTTSAPSAYVAKSRSGVGPARVPGSTVIFFCMPLAACLWDGSLETGEVGRWDVGIGNRVSQSFFFVASNFQRFFGLSIYKALLPGREECCAPPEACVRVLRLCFGLPLDCALILRRLCRTLVIRW